MTNKRKQNFSLDLRFVIFHNKELKKKKKRRSVLLRISLNMKSVNACNHVQV